MSTPRVLRFLVLHVAQRLAALLVLAIAAAGAIAQEADPPGRVAYLNHRQGTLSVSPSGDDSWYEPVANRPFTQGDRLWTDRGGRAELYVGDTAVRMDEQTQLEITELGDQSLRLTMQQGRVQVRLRGDSGEPQRVELGTGNVAVVMRSSGDYRVLADPKSDSTQVMVGQGSATVFGESGQSQELVKRQQAVYTGRDLGAGGMLQALPEDFERWLAERSQLEEQSRSARYISREIPGYQQLDQHGQWQDDPTYGAVWYPSNVASDWAPYSDGYWTVVAPYGYTWIDRAPWGFAPFHYGRWTRIGLRWCWVPGPRHARPVYSPALVAFVGGAGGQLAIRGDRPAVGWFPLAPGERWRPPYRASERYIDRANRAIAGVPPLLTPPGYANRSLPHAVTAIPVDRFGRGGRIGRQDFVRLPGPTLAAAPVSQRPPVPLPAVHAGGAGPDRRADPGFPGRRTQAAPPAIAAFAPPQADRFHGERRQRPPDAPLRAPQLGQPGIALPQQQPILDTLPRAPQFSQQEQMRQQHQLAQAQQQLQQQDNQRRIRQAQQEQERQQRDVMIQHNQVQQQQALQRQQFERAQRELRMQQSQQQGAMRDRVEQQQRQQQFDRQQQQQLQQQQDNQRRIRQAQQDQERQQRDVMIQHNQQQQQQALQRQQIERAQRELRMQQSQQQGAMRDQMEQQQIERQQQMEFQQRHQRQIQQQQQQQQMARQQQEMQLRAQQQQQAQRERQQPGGANRMRGVPGMAAPQQR